MEIVAHNMATVEVPRRTAEPAATRNLVPVMDSRRLVTAAVPTTVAAAALALSMEIAARNTIIVARLPTTVLQQKIARASTANAVVVKRPRKHHPRQRVHRARRPPARPVPRPVPCQRVHRAPRSPSRLVTRRLPRRLPHQVLRQFPRLRLCRHQHRPQPHRHACNPTFSPTAPILHNAANPQAVFQAVVVETLAADQMAGNAIHLTDLLTRNAATQAVTTVLAVVAQFPALYSSGRTGWCAIRESDSTAGISPSKHASRFYHLSD